MGSRYYRGESIWLKYRNASGDVDRRASGYRRGQESKADALLREIERQVLEESRKTPKPTQASAVAPMAAPQPAHPARSNGTAAPVHVDAPTVKQYGEQWIERRRGHIGSVDDEETRLALHVYPYIGSMALPDVRPRHIRDLICTIKQKTSDSSRNKGQRLAPRTVRHVFMLLGRLFKSAVIDEHIAASPVVIEKGLLPKNVDKDPSWRPTAIYERKELVLLLSHPRIKADRRVFIALKGLAGVRHGEAAGLRWSAYDTSCEPLGKLIVSRSYEKDGTKTKATREVPVHPVLARILTEWKERGWAKRYKRAPRPDDLIVPTRNMKPCTSTNALKRLQRELALCGIRGRRAHDLRRTFVSAAQEDGIPPHIVKIWTHSGNGDVLSMYTTIAWSVQCAELMKLTIELPPVDASTDHGDDDGGDDGGDDEEASRVLDDEASADEPAPLAASPDETISVPTVPRHLGTLPTVPSESPVIS